MHVHYTVNTPYVFMAALRETPKDSPKDEKVYICGWIGHVCSLQREPNHCDVCMYQCYMVYHS